MTNICLEAVATSKSRYAEPKHHIERVAFGDPPQRKRYRMRALVLITLQVAMFSSCAESLNKDKPMKSTVGVFLAKANDNLISHCNCQETFNGAPAQMDCPWCGCGWLFICPKCRKAFAFARAVKCDLTWEQLAHRDLDGKYGQQPDEEEIEEWIDFMKMMTKEIELGKEYAYIDSRVIKIDAKNLKFEGVHAWHDLPSVPQADAISDKQLLEQTLGSRHYWDQQRINRQ